jgi:AraC family transcriptional regulator, regulatory protein of adaptative response / DNA-3-methyladenine glycosylase II
VHPPDTTSSPWLDHERCYRAVSSRDARFDGWFYTAVRTTGIYCRPSCPAITPRRRNVEFLPTAAAAQQRGYRACKRCRPDASPGSPAWDQRSDIVARCMRLIEDGAVDRDGVGGLARRLGYSPRHLTRLLTAELGAGPLALARAQRAQAARLLVETTAMPLTDVAFAAGFASVRQFNDTFREVFDASPSDLRRRPARGAGPVTGGGGISIRLATRQPFAGGAMMEFLARRAVPGVEHHGPDGFRRSLALPHGHGVATLAPGDGYVTAQLRLADWRDLAPAVRRIRRLLDLDGDPEAIDELLGAHPVLARSVAATPGLRVPGSVDPVETAVRAVIGQQVSVAGARTVTGRLVVACGRPLEVADGALTHVFPDAEELAAVGDEALPMPASRRRTVRAVATAVADGAVALHLGADRAEVERQLLAIPGIGPWTASYVMMRGLHDPDVFLPTDLGVCRTLTALGSTVAVADDWRPWRSYAVHHLWTMSPRQETPT